MLNINKKLMSALTLALILTAVSASGSIVCTANTTIDASGIKIDNINSIGNMTISGNGSGIVIGGMTFSEFINSGYVYDNIEDLKQYVYDEAQVTEVELDVSSVLSLDLSSDNINITSGGDKLIIRYYEWYENQYTLSILDDEVSIKQNGMKYFLKSGNNTTGIHITNNWYRAYLLSQNKLLHNTIEIIIPQSMLLDTLQINAGESHINASDCVFNDIFIGVGSGKIDLKDCIFSGGALMSAGSGTVTANDCGFNGEMSLSAGSGCVEIKNCAFSNYTSVSAGSGNIYIGDCKLESDLHISVGSGNGNVKLVDSVLNYDIQLNTSKGKLIYNGEKVANDSLQNQDAAFKINLSCGSGSFSITGDK